MNLDYQRARLDSICGVHLQVLDEIAEPVPDVDSRLYVSSIAVAPPITASEGGGSPDVPSRYEI